MKAVKKNACIQNNTLIIHDLDSLNYKEVDVIIIPKNNSTPTKFKSRHTFHRK
ncbi:MAG: hypothetical protein JW864_11610 [Spirochaetes bacterium]|nr:hypothetical protein [Spirochaetota bacterium]